MDSKTRAKLRAISNKINVVFQIGHEGVTENVVMAVNDALHARELIKINVLKTCPETPKNVLDCLCDKTGADPICIIGQKIVLYKISNKKNIKHLLTL